MTITHPTEDEITLMLRAECHRGSERLQRKMADYVFKKNDENQSHVINLLYTWTNIHAAALMLVAVPRAADVCLVSTTPWGQRAVFKFAQLTGSFSVSDRFTPGTFTNPHCKSFREPSVLVVCDPELDKQAMLEASAVNIPVIALCDVDSCLRNVDLAIPCNNKSKLSVAAALYVLCSQLLQMRGEPGLIERDVPVDLFIFKTAEELDTLIETDRNTELERVRKAEVEKRKAFDDKLLADAEPEAAACEPTPRGDDEDTAGSPRGGQGAPGGREVTAEEPGEAATAYESLGASLEIKPADNKAAYPPAAAADPAPAESLGGRGKEAGEAAAPPAMGMGQFYPQFGGFYPPPHMFAQMGLGGQPARAPAGQREGYVYPPYAQGPYGPGYGYPPAHMGYGPGPAAERSTDGADGGPRGGGAYAGAGPAGYGYQVPPYMYQQYQMPPGYMGYGAQVPPSHQQPPQQQAHQQQAHQQQAYQQQQAHQQQQTPQQQPGVHGQGARGGDSQSERKQ